MMQGHLRIKDIISSLTDEKDINYNTRAKQLNVTIKNLWNQQYLKTVNWWNLMSSDDLAAKLHLEEEKLLRGDQSTSASMTAKQNKEATENAKKRLNELKQENRGTDSLKRKAHEKTDLKTFRDRKRRKIDNDSDEEEEITFDFDVSSSLSGINVRKTLHFL